MRSSVFVLGFLLLLAGCRSGSIEAVQVENPDVTAVAAPTRTAPTAVPDVESTTTLEGGTSAVPDPTPPPADATSSDDTNAESDATSTGDEEPTNNDAQADAATNESQTDEPAADESEDVADDSVLDPDELLTLDVGAVTVDPTDPWCVVADQVNDNYRAVSAVDQTDPLYLEAVFRQTYESVEVAAQVAPAEIANEAETERWLWQQVVEAHAEADWVITSVDFARVSELGEANRVALQSVDEYTSSTCG